MVFIAESTSACESIVAVQSILSILSKQRWAAAQVGAGTVPNAWPIIVHIEPSCGLPHALARWHACWNTPTKKPVELVLPNGLAVPPFFGLNGLCSGSAGSMLLFA